MSQGSSTSSDTESSGKLTSRVTRPSLADIAFQTVWALLCEESMRWWLRRSRWPPAARSRCQGLSTTLMAPSCFFWKISYACGASSKESRWVAKSSTPSGSSSPSSGKMSGAHFLTLA